MTEWIDIAKFKQRKGEVYAFYHPEYTDQYGKNKNREWVMCDRTLPTHPRKPTLYAVITLPGGE